MMADQSRTSDDGFTLVMAGKRGSPRNTDHVTFGRQHATLPEIEACTEVARADWEHSNGTVRCRIHDNGQYKRSTTGGFASQLSVGMLYRAIGRQLRGSYPITRVDGCDLYIDISDSERDAGQRR